MISCTESEKNLYVNEKLHSIGPGVRGLLKRPSSVRTCMFWDWPSIHACFQVEIKSIDLSAFEGVRFTHVLQCYSPSPWEKVILVKWVDFSSYEKPIILTLTPSRSSITLHLHIIERVRFTSIHSRDRKSRAKIKNKESDRFQIVSFFRWKLIHLGKNWVRTIDRGFSRSLKNN